MVASAYWDFVVVYESSSLKNMNLFFAYLLTPFLRPNKKNDPGFGPLEIQILIAALYDVLSHGISLTRYNTSSYFVRII